MPDTHMDHVSTLEVRDDAVTECDVIVVGSGPVGLALAIDLAQRGVRTVIADTKLEPLKLPKMERTNPRSMEIFRRLGVADRIRERGYPSDCPMDCFIVTSLVEPPIVHHRYASVDEARSRIAASTDGRLPREPYQLVSQYTLEPILIEELEAQDTATFARGHTLGSFEQTDEGVLARFTTTDGGTRTYRAKYMVGCDGGASTVRKQLGIPLEGRGRIANVRQVFFRSEDFFDHCKLGHGRHYAFAARSHGGAGAGGIIVVQDDQRHFTLQTTAAADTDWTHEVRDTVGAPIDVQILYVGEWTQHMLVAEQFSENRIFLAGDSNHMFIPAGGLGMNTGIGDAHNLAWKLAGLVQGWGGPGLAASYEAERQPTVRRNREAVDYAIRGVVEWRGLAATVAFDGPPSDDSDVAAFAEAAEPLNRRVYEMHGTELGYRYESGIVVREDTPPPPDEIRIYQPSTFPGCSLPHVWLPDGTALHDRLGAGFILLDLSEGGSSGETLAHAMKGLGAPFETITISAKAIREIFEHDLVLVRPDLHVCWRGDRLPDDCTQLAALVTGNT